MPPISAELASCGGPSKHALIDGGWSGAEEADQLAGSGAALSIDHEQNVPAGAARRRALLNVRRRGPQTELMRCSKKKKVGIEHREQ